MSTRAWWATGTISCLLASLFWGYMAGYTGMWEAYAMLGLMVFGTFRCLIEVD